MRGVCFQKNISGIPLESCVIFHAFLSSADFFQNQLFQKIFQEHYPSVKWLCLSCSGSKLFAKIFS